MLKYVSEAIYKFIMGTYDVAETLALICIIIAFISLAGVVVEAILKNRKS